MVRIRWMLGLFLLLSGISCLRVTQTGIGAAVEDSAVQYRPVRLYYTNSSGEQGFTTHVYDAAGNCVWSIWELVDGTRWSTNTYVYDAAGHMVEKNRVFSDELTSKQTFTYDDSGRLILETYSRSDGKSGTVRYVFDDTHHVEIAYCDRMNGWLSGVITYQLDPKGRRMTGVLRKNGKDLGTISFTRNEDGLLEQERWQIGNWSQTFKTEYERFNCHAPTTSNPYVPGNCNWRVGNENYSFDGKVGGPSSYMYDEDGRLVEKTFTRSDGLRTLTTYHYDSDGILEKSVRRFADGRMQEFHYAFNSNRQLVERTWMTENGHPGLEAYQYDQNGTLTGARYEGMDGWLTGDLTFVHDRYGNLSTGTYDGDNELTAEIEFACNKNGLPVRIYWTFSSGHTQEYRFSYETVP